MEFVEFSPNENFMLTWNGATGKKNVEAIKLFDLKSGKCARAFPYVVFEREAREFQSFQFFMFSITSLKLEEYHSHSYQNERSNLKVDYDEKSDTNARTQVHTHSQQGSMAEFQVQS